MIENRAILISDQSVAIYLWSLRPEVIYKGSKKTKISINSNITFHIDQEIINSVSLPIQADLGRYEVTEKPKDRWKFRTSSLRNVAITPPYMHDGGFATLEEVIDFYNQGGSGHSMQDKRIRPLNLLNQEKIDLKNFLKSFSQN